MAASRFLKPVKPARTACRDRYQFRLDKHSEEYVLEAIVAPALALPIKS